MDELFESRSSKLSTASTQRCWSDRSVASPLHRRDLADYPWSGNVRELKNLAEYLVYLDKQVIENKDLLPMLKWPKTPEKSKGSTVSVLPEADSPEKEHVLFILDSLHTSYQNRRRSGRRSLFESAWKHDLFLSEAQIRTVLTKMGDHGLLHLANGRGGTTITPSGIEALKRLRED